MGQRGEEGSILLHRTSCLKCREQGHDRAGDNLAIYSDGHEYCYKCGYIKSNKNYYRQRAITTKQFRREGFSWGFEIPRIPWKWLTERYGLTLQEILDNKIQWDEQKKLLIFPVYIDDDLVMYQGRYFGSGDYPKYITHGYVSSTYNIHWKDTLDKTIVLVEDFISSIKVSRVLNSMPLFGSSIPTRRLRVLSQSFERLIIWLDKDKQHEYPSLLNKAGTYFDSCKCIFSSFDPKQYSEEEIKCLV